VQLRKPFLLEIIAYNLNSERLEVLISVRTQLTQCALKFGRGKKSSPVTDMHEGDDVFARLI